MYSPVLGLTEPLLRKMPDPNYPSQSQLKAYTSFFIAPPNVERPISSDLYLDIPLVNETGLELYMSRYQDMFIKTVRRITFSGITKFPAWVAFLTKLTHVAVVDSPEFMYASFGNRHPKVLHVHSNHLESICFENCPKLYFIDWEIGRASCRERVLRLW